MIIIEQRKRHQLNRSNGNNLINSNHHPISSTSTRKGSTTRKRRFDSIPNGTVEFEKNSLTNFPTSSNATLTRRESDFDGNSDPLPRRNRSTGSNSITAVPPPLPPPRGTILHSKSLSNVVQQPSIHQTNHKICTAV